MKYEILSSSHSIQARFRNARALCRHTSVSSSLRKTTSTVQTSSPTTSAQPLSQSSFVVTPHSPGEAFFKKSDAQVAVLVSPPKPCELKLKDTESKSTKKTKRRNPLTVRLSDVEQEMVKAKAKMIGCSVNSFVKAAVLGYRFPPVPELIKTLFMLNRELTAQGNNLNQIARHLNGVTISPEQGLSMMDTLGHSMLRTHKEVRKALSNGQPEPQP